MKAVKTAPIILMSILLVLILAVGVSATGNKLDIDKVVIDVDGDQEFSGSGDGHIYVEPDQELEFEVKIENMWDRDNDDPLDIEDVIVSAVLYDIDDGDDLSYSSSRFDLRAEGYKTIRWDWDVPEDADSDQNYELEIQVRGYDEEGVLHEDDLVIDVEVDRERHNLVFEDLEVSDPSPCSDFARIRVEVENKGDNDEDVMLTVESDYKGVLFEKEFEVEDFDSDDNTYAVTRTIDVSGWDEGRYTIDFLVEYDDNELKESEDLRIPDCHEKGHYDSDDDDKSDDGDNWETLVTQEDLSHQRSANAELFRQIQSQEKAGDGLVVEFKEDTFVPTTAFPGEKNKGFDWGLAGLVVANIVLLVLVIVVLVLIGIQVFEV